MKMNTKLKNIVICFILLFVGVLLFINTKSVFNGAYKGILNCLNIVIPSLFPFTVFTIFLTESGYYNKIFSLPSALLSKILYINKSYCSIFLTGLIGGYHSAAKNVSILCKKGYISRRDSGYLIAAATNAGPAFLISAVGSGLFLSANLGAILYFASVLSSITLFIIFSPRLKGYKQNNIYKKQDISKSIVISVKETCNVLCAMSAFIILFSVIISLLEEKLKCSNLLKSVIFGFIEVTNGCIYSANEISLSSILITSIICSFGGLCVMLQIFSICNDAKISIKPLIFSRILHTILSFIYTFLLILIIPISSKQTFISNTSSANASFVTSPIPALLLLVCCFCFPIYISRQKNL